MSKFHAFEISTKEEERQDILPKTHRGLFVTSLSIVNK